MNGKTRQRGLHGMCCNVSINYINSLPKYMKATLKCLRKRFAMKLACCALPEL